MPKKLLIALISLGTISFLVFGVLGESSFKSSLATAVLGGETLSLEVADTPSLRQKGLSGHPPLGDHEGMLFVFPEEGLHSFWMKDMLFPIDIIWLDREYRIVDVWERADPKSYPQAVSPRLPARFVVELPAGFFQEHNLKVGNILEITR